MPRRSPKQPGRESPADPFERVKKVGLALPEVEAATKYDGSPILRFRGCFMAGLATHPSAEGGTLVVRVDLEEREWLLQDAPETYYLTDYYRRHPVVLVRLSRVDENALRDLLTVSRRLTLAKAPTTRRMAHATGSMWVCPKCKRRFANRNQTHTCGLHTLDRHFSGRPPQIRTLFEAVRQAIEALGPVIVLPEKTRIAFQVRMSFAQLTPRNGWLDGHLVLARRRDHPRFRKVETLSPGNHVHHFRITTVDEIDAQFLALLAEAYAVGEQRHLRPGSASLLHRVR